MKDLTEQDKSVQGMRKSRHDRNQARTEQPRDDKTRLSEPRNCGRKHKTKQKCPARQKVCFKCKKPNIIQECVGVKSCMICNRKLMNLNLKRQWFFYRSNQP